MVSSDLDKPLALSLSSDLQSLRTHYHLRKEKPILSLLASIAKSLVFDLGLNKIPSEPYISVCFKTPFLPLPKEISQEERRAVLATFLLTSQ